MATQACGKAHVSTDEAERYGIRGRTLRSECMRAYFAPRNPCRASMATFGNGYALPSGMNANKSWPLRVQVRAVELQKVKPDLSWNCLCSIAFAEDYARRKAANKGKV